ncbi:MAG: CatB-related O-acetyltransferase [Eubacterium sp.]|nr:CatB-related O-acetyltransferase [Eubacterium sp.]
MILKSMLKRRKLKNKLAKRGIQVGHDADITETTFGDYANVAHHAQISRSKIGLRTSVGRYSKIQYAKIGKYCSISWDVTIGALEHPIHSISTHAFPYRKQFGLCSKDVQIPHKEVVIGNDVWIGCGTIIMPGVKIGNGAVIGAGSVVTHDVEDYAVVAGCPAKLLRMRFRKELVELLQKIAWWDLEDDKLKSGLQLFAPDVDLNLEENEKKLLKWYEKIKQEAL